MKPPQKLSKDTDSLSQLLTLGVWSVGQPLRLHLGCGEQGFPGYINIDYPPEEHNVMNTKADVYSDILELEFPPESVDEVRLHHVFEHFNRVTALYLLIKWHEWLKIGGELIIETPDIIGSSKTLLSNAPLKIKTGVIRHLAGDQADAWAYHIDHWFPERFERTLDLLGFTSIQTQSYTQPHEPFLSNVTAYGQKVRNIPLEEQLSTAEIILGDSILSPAEKPIYDVLKANLLKVFQQSTKI